MIEVIKNRMAALRMPIVSEDAARSRMIPQRTRDAEKRESSGVSLVTLRVSDLRGRENLCGTYKI